MVELILECTAGTGLYKSEAFRTINAIAERELQGAKVSRCQGFKVSMVGPPRNTG
jgi:hypothetical protein